MPRAADRAVHLVEILVLRAADRAEGAPLEEDPLEGAHAEVQVEHSSIYCSLYCVRRRCLAASTGLAERGSQPDRQRKRKGCPWSMGFFFLTPCGVSDMMLYTDRSRGRGGKEVRPTEMDNIREMGHLRIPETESSGLPGLRFSIASKCSILRRLCRPSPTS